MRFVWFKKTLWIKYNTIFKLKSKYLLVKLAVSNTATPEAVFKTLTLFGVLLLAPGWGSSSLVNNMMENQIQCRVSDYFSETERWLSTLTSCSWWLFQIACLRDPSWSMPRYARSLHWYWCRMAFASHWPRQPAWSGHSESETGMFNQTFFSAFFEQTFCPRGNSHTERKKRNTRQS